MARACFLGGARFTEPLDPTAEKKFRALARLGEMNVVAFSADRRFRAFVEHARFHLLPSLASAPLRHVMMLSIGAALALRCVLHRRVEVLVAQSPYEGAAAVAAKLLARVFGRRVALVVENHGDFEEGPFLQRHVPFRGPVETVLRAAAAFAFSHADALRAVSSSTEAQVRRWAPGRPVVRFAAWTDLETFLAAGDPRPPRGAPTVLYAGVLVRGKGVHHLLDAWPEVRRGFREARLVVAGAPKDPEYARGLREQAARLGAATSVEFLGALPQADLARRMAEADVLVLPTLSEALGLVLLEAMACGTPVVASSVGGTSDLVRDGENGFLVPPGDSRSIAERVAWVLSHPEESAGIGHRGRAFARAFGLEEGFLSGYARLFDAALGGVRG
ncbi:MAG: glycosyltransferase [Planctomycetota bacterium]